MKGNVIYIYNKHNNHISSHINLENQKEKERELAFPPLGGKKTAEENMSH